MPQIGELPIHGITFYDGKKIILGPAGKGKGLEHFLFSFYHEIGHIVLGYFGKKEGFSKEAEKAADEYSHSMLIS